MTHDLGGFGPGSRPVACRHDNQAGNRYCDACGADRGQRRCPLCSTSNRDQAKFCGACGARLLDEGATPDTMARGTLPHAWERDAGAARDPGRRAGSGPRLPGDILTLDAQARSGRGVDRHDDLTERDMTEEEDWAPRDRRRQALLLVATMAVAVTAVVAIIIGLARFGPARDLGGPGRAGDSVVASRGPATADRSVAPAVGEGAGSVAPAAPEPVSPSAPLETTGPVRPALEATGPPAALPPPSRSGNELPAGQGEESPREHVPASRSSEERVADFLIEQFGRATAAEKALSTAAWYDVGQPERAYWQRVAEAIKRRSGS